MAHDHRALVNYSLCTNQHADGMTSSECTASGGAIAVPTAAAGSGAGAGWNRERKRGSARGPQSRSGILKGAAGKGLGRWSPGDHGGGLEGTMPRVRPGEGRKGGLRGTGRGSARSHGCEKCPVSLDKSRKVSCKSQYKGGDMLSPPFLVAFAGILLRRRIEDSVPYIR